ncbi:putative Bromodomain testis-specific protein [Whalleya microplaca]|nr:putative Bromodomain testis-specific protein [Whalleya microplaca]
MADDAGEGQAAATFSWSDPHAIFVIVLVGEDEVPFGLQKDFLSAKSPYFKAILDEKTKEELEHIVKLPNTSRQVFGLAQNYMFTGKLIDDNEPESLPGYEALMAVWKLGDELGIAGLCDEALATMTEYKRITQHIPAVPLLVQAWKDTAKGSSLRTLLVTWAVDYIRSSEAREEFSQSLPQEILSEIVLSMHASPAVQVKPEPSSGRLVLIPRKGVHHLPEDDEDDEPHPKALKHRHSDLAVGRSKSGERKTAPKKTGPRASLPSSKPSKAKRVSMMLNDDQSFTMEQKLGYCDNLLTRMLSGPGFWTRLVGPFKEPVRPIEDGVPDYLDKIKTPMDLGTVKKKMDRKEYTTEEEFLADVRQIFENCYTYWGHESGMGEACQKLQSTFEEKYRQRGKWMAQQPDEAI